MQTVTFREGRIPKRCSFPFFYRNAQGSGLCVSDVLQVFPGKALDEMQQVLDESRHMARGEEQESCKRILVTSATLQS